MMSVAKKLFLFVLLCGLFVLPFVYWYRAPVAYEIPRVWCFMGWVNVLLMLFILSGEYAAFSMQRSRVWKHTALFVLIALCASLIGVDVGNSIWGNYYRRDGLITLLYCFVFYSMIQTVWSRIYRSMVMLSIAASSVVLSVWAIGTFIERWVHVYDIAVAFEEPIGISFGQPVFLAGYLVVTIPALVYIILTAKKAWKKWVFLLAVIAQCIAIVLTHALGAILTLGLYPFLLLFIHSRKRYVRYGVLLVVIGIICTAALLLYRHIQALPGQGVILAEGRDRIVVKGILGFLNRPFFGWGWANYYKAFVSVEWPYPFTVDAYIDKAHSTVLEVVVTTGIIGLIVYIGLLVRVITNVCRCKKMKKDMVDRIWYSAVLQFFILFFIHAQTNVISISEEILFWLFLGVIV